MHKATFLFGAASLALAVGCGGGAAPPAVSPAASGTGGTRIDAVNESVQKQYETVVEAFVAHDKAADWTDASCAEIASRFEQVARGGPGGKLPEATFNAGLAYQRCGNDKEARARFQRALSEDPAFHHAKAQLALYGYKDNGSEDQAITSLQQAVIESKFENVPALVNLAMFQMMRDSSASGDQCKDDMDCAKRNLQRALAKDDGYMPAFNQLALYYFQLAKKRAGSQKLSAKGSRGRSVVTSAALGKRADVQQLELALLVCSQAIRKNPNYAPIHNTAGLIQNELGLVNGAVREFSEATKLDPKFFEAQMNFAAVNLSFRGFKQAEGAYRKALEMRPNDYDAHLGLALALRGQIDDSTYDQQVAAVQAELDACKKLDSNRPDVYYNEGILTHEFKAKGGTVDKQIAVLDQAEAIFQQFIDKATGKSEYDGAVKRAKERVQDIRDTKDFLKAGAPSGPAAPPAAPSTP